MTTTSKLAKQYQKKTDREHILDAPDTYIGSVEENDNFGWVFDPTTPTPRVTFKKFKWIPGLYKLFDEGIVNCRDHVIRMIQRKDSGVKKTKLVSYIYVDISDDGLISMTNDGNGIDIEKHPEHNIWIPEMIFGHLRTSTNYDKTEKRIVGGKNGFGFKLVLIWSSWGMVETVDHTRKLKYTQEFSDNLTKIGKPKIEKYEGAPYTKVSFRPDYKRLGISGLNPDLFNLLKKRVFDIAAVTPRKVEVKFNSSMIHVRNFTDYVNMYIGSNTDTKRVFETADDRWEFAACISPYDEFTQVSFVNGINTMKGGKHVDYILNKIVKGVSDYIKKKKKITVKPVTIKEQLMLFVNCSIENPSFDSQTKDFMNTPPAKFGSSCSVSEKFIEKIAKLGIMDTAISLTEVKSSKEAKKTDGSKTSLIRGIPKCIDANFAGTAKSGDCTLILCEGDSAKAGIVSGLSKDDRNYIGVYPMKGKLFNVRGETIKRICENAEISDIKKIMGLVSGFEYKTQEDIKKKLRYGKIIFMTDQDLDGSHIKGLGVNLFQSQWHDLIANDNFIGFMNTPILKATKGKSVRVFYNDGEYEQWKKENSSKGWKIKYYKGLGTSTAKEFKEYFQEKKTVLFKHSGKDSDNSIDMVFNKKRADDRKDWLGEYSRDNYLDTNQPAITYEEFIKGEMIHFSKYDCDRSIPNIMDGLKTSLRKILYSAFKKGLTSEIKVAQFSGYVSEHSGYHHGEASLNKAIVGMAQNYVGSNNINLFMPNGQFGTRLQGGKDSASERYIFTKLNEITRSVYPEMDDNILKYLDDDGFPVEPIYYGPIIPMLLVNGSKGIGTGFSTDIMCYNPQTLIEIVRWVLKGKKGDAPVLTPYYEGFKGDIEKIEEKKYLIRGVYEKVGTDKVRITELPVGSWTDDYKQYLETLMDTTTKTGKKKKPVIKSYIDMSTDTLVDITVTFPVGAIAKMETTLVEYGCSQLEKTLKLYTTNTTTNMHAFTHEEKLKKYETVYDIINDYMNERLRMYTHRKDYMIKSLERELMLLSNKAKYIMENLKGTIDLRRKKKEQIIDMLVKKEYDVIDDDNDFKYLVKMPMDSVSEENVERLLNDKDVKSKELEIVRETTERQMWLKELKTLETVYQKYKTKREDIQKGEVSVKKTVKRKVIRKKKVAK